MNAAVLICLIKDVNLVYVLNPFQIAETILTNCPLIDVNAFHFTTGETSLHLAAANDSKYLVELLLKNEKINLYSQVKRCLKQNQR